jgi:TolC family type I secretion outer membrane protein
MRHGTRPPRWALVALAVSALVTAGRLRAQDAADARPLTIEAAVETALAHHPSLAIARNQLQAAQGATRQSRSGLLPSLGLNSGYSRAKSTGSAVVGGVPVGSSGARYSTQYSTAFQGQHLLFDFGRTRDQHRQSRFQELARRHDLAQTEDDAVYNAQQAFLVLLTNQELLEVARHAVRLSEGSLAMAQAQFDAGAAPRADVAKAASALAAARLQVTSAENAVALSHVSLNEAMGLDVLSPHEIAPPAEADVAETTPEALVQAATTHRPELLAARAEADAADAGLDAAQKGQLPALDLSAALGWRDPTFPASNQYWNLGLSLSLNVFDAGLTRGQKTQARAQRDAALNTIRLLEQQVAEETVQTYLDLRTADQEIVAAEVGVASADEDLQLAQGRYQADVGILLEVLDAQSALTTAQGELAQARFRRATARYALERALGMSLSELSATIENG